MKLKLSLKSSGGFKGFMLAHGEKFVAGLVALCVVVLLYQAIIGVKSLDVKKQPDELLKLAEKARTNVDSTSAEAVQLTSNDPSSIVKSITDIDLEPYSIEAPLNPPLFPEKVKRADPVLYSIEDLEVNASFGSIAVIDNNPVPITQLPPAAGRSGVRPGTRSALPGSRNPRAGGGRYAQRGAAQRGRFSRPGTGRGAAGRGGRGTGRRGAGRQGFRGSGGDGDGGLQRGAGYATRGRSRMGTIDMGATVRPGFSKPELRHWVAVLAKVPVAKQAQAYRRALARADFFQRGEAIPKYFAYEVQRAEVTGDGKQQWKRVAGVNSNLIMKMTEDWASVAREVVDRRYIDPLLTFPLPPVVGRGWGASATHSDIPLAADAYGAPTPAAGDANKKDSEKKDDTDVGLFDNTVAGALPYGRGMGRGRVMGGGYPSRRPPSRSRYGDGDGGGRRYSGMGRSRGRLPGGDGYGSRRRSPMRGSMRGGMRGYGGRRSFGGGYSGGAEEIKNYLFRFFDFKVEPGKRYQYRVRLVLFDPNDNVEDQYLENSVINRRMAAKRKQFRFTDWSESSPAVVVPFSRRVLAGPVKAASASRFNAEPSLQALVKQIDKKKGFDAAHEIERMWRGSVGNLTTSVDVFDQNLNQFTTIEKYDFRTGAVLLDMRGGRRLSTRNDKLTEPGEVLFLSPGGRLLVRNELDDLEEYQRYRDTLPAKDPMDGTLPAAGRNGYQRGGRSMGPGGYGRQRPGRGGMPPQRVRPQ